MIGRLGASKRKKARRISEASGVAVKTNVPGNRRMIADMIREYSLSPAREAGESQVVLRADGGLRAARRAGSFYRSDRKFDLRQELKKWL